MSHNVDYNKTYTPVTSWETVRRIFVLSLVHEWTSWQIDYIITFPQAPIDKPTYTRIPPCLKIPGDPRKYALSMHRNLYKQKESGRIWFQYLTNKLSSIRFEQSNHDPCVFFRKGCIYVLYTDDYIFLHKTSTQYNRSSGNYDR